MNTQLLRIITIFSISLLIVSVFVVLFFSFNSIGSRANIDKPTNISVDTIEDTSATVVFSADIDKSYTIAYGKDPAKLTLFSIPKLQNNTTIFKANLSLLEPNTIYFFELRNSSGIPFNNEGIPWQFKTNAKTTKLNIDALPVVEEVPTEEEKSCNANTCAQIREQLGIAGGCSVEDLIKKNCL